MLVHLFGVPHLFLVMFDLALIIIIIITICLNRMTISVIKTAINMGPV